MKNVIIYCAYGYGDRVTCLLDHDKYRVIGYVDDKDEIQGERIFGGGNVGTVYAPDQLVRLEFDYIIISMVEYSSSIKKKLVENYNVDENKIIVFSLFDKKISCVDERVAMLKKCIAMLKERNIHGNMAELGVYTGEFSRLFNKYLPEKKLYLFDTFSGFDSKRDDVDISDINIFKDTSVQLVMDKMVAPEQCIIKKGYFPDTVRGVEDEFCLVSLDADLYNPILAGLEYFYPRLVPGGYIFVHDFGSYHYTGVKQAVYDYCEKNNIAMVPIIDKFLSVIISK